MANKVKLSERRDNGLTRDERKTGSKKARRVGDAAAVHEGLNEVEPRG